jgi:hypothetical protein
MIYNFHTTNLALVSLGADLGELEDDVLASELTIDLAKSIDLVVNTSTLLGIKENLDNLVAVLLRTYTLADDLGGVDKITKDSVMDGGESPTARTLLLDARAATRKREDATLSNEDDVAVGELLLELTGESVRSISFRFEGPKEQGIYLCCTLWKPDKRGTGTKITIAFLPWPTSIYPPRSSK